MPKAFVATMTGASSAMNARWLSARSAAGMPGMVARRAHAGGDERGVHLVGVLAGGAVHDPRVARVRQRVAPDPGELALGLHALHAEVQVRAVEPRDHLVGVAQVEQAHDVAAHALGGRGREGRHDGPIRQLLDEVAHGQVRRAEVLAPLRHAVRLVHGHERDGGLACELEEARVGQALRRHVHDLVGARQRAAQHGGLLARRERGVEVGAAHARVEERAHLVAHERHERAHHEREPLHHDAGHLVAHRLARARGHDRQRVAAGEDRLHHALLPRTELLVAEMLPQCRFRGRHLNHRALPSPGIRALARLAIIYRKRPRKTGLHRTLRCVWCRV